MNDSSEKIVPLKTAPSPTELPNEKHDEAPKPSVPAQKIPNTVLESKPDFEAKDEALVPTEKEKPEATPKKPKVDQFATLRNLFFRLSVKDKMLFARHMEMMTRSGLQVLDALQILRKQTKKQAFLNILDSLIADVQNGHYLSAAMEKYKNIFGEFIINLIRVGETSGTLSDNFRYLAEELEKKSELRKKVIGALIYPIVILVATLGITGIMIFLIFPRVLPVLTSLNVELPLATVIFIWISEFIINNGIWIALGLIALVVGWMLLLRLRTFRFQVHKMLLRFPLVGPLITDVNVITISRTMNLLLKGGVRIVEALDISSRSLNNLVYQQQMKDIGLSVQRGERMSKLMIERPEYFPTTFSEMSNVGETTGKLDETLEFLATFYESELDGSTKTMSNVMEPLLLLTMGLVVTFVAISIITPIYKISQSLGR